MLEVTGRWKCLNWPVKIYGFLLFILVTGMGISRADNYLSPSQIIYFPSDSRLYIVQSTARRVDVLESESFQVVRSIDFEFQLGGLALSPNGQQLYVTALDKGQVVFYDLNRDKVETSILVGCHPHSPLLSPDGDILYVCNRFDNNVLVIDTAKAAVVDNIAVIREPIAGVLTNNGKFLFVANHLPAGAADVDYSASQISVIDTILCKQVKTIGLPNGSTGVRGICMSPDERYVYISHILSHYQLPTTQLDRGWMTTNAVSIVDVKTQSMYTTFLLDDVDHGAANPWAIACSPDGACLYVTHAGTSELSIIDRPGLHRKLDALASGKKVSNVIDSFKDVSRDLSFLIDLRERIQLEGQGPRSLAVVKDRIFVGQYFSDSLVVINPLSGVQKTVALNSAFEMTPVHQGEIFFNDASLCFQNWQSCASCHPDGRSDGLNWDLLNDGIGNPKNTKSLLLAHQTPPVMVTGIRDRAETAVRAGIRYIQFAHRSEADASAIDTYLKSMKPAVSPYLIDGKLSPSAYRGKQLFEAAGCEHCHSGPVLTNRKPFDVGTGQGQEAATAYDTPTLVEIWRTAPYLHKGQAATMKDVLTQYNHDDRHGKVSGLTENQMQDLITYILSL